MTLLQWSFAFVAGSICGVANAAVEPFSCPPSLPAMTQSLQEAPAGFSVQVDRPYQKHKLDGFRVQLGPIDTADATPYDQIQTQQDVKGGTTETLTWNVSTVEDPYAVCSYSATTLVLVRSLKGYQQCKVVSAAAPSGLLGMQSAVCR